ncbi:tRNA lysidine(34) synthetase TilS [Reichenbachiella sp. 5M10]|nr:tRNA lysidine(34) synthetase TilS [Reichenbachiella sp. 5M10]
MDLPEKFEAFVTKHALFGKKNKLLVAVSGGIDSVVLCYLLHDLHYDFAIAHCNFGLRGQSSDEDETFVKNLAQSLNTPYYTETFDTLQHASREGVSTQMAARDLRYAWFEQLRKTAHYDYLLTAHHANDLLETSLFNFTKGTSIAGLRSIRRKHKEIVRPLSFARKEDIHDYARHYQLVWREDSSNESNKYHRNKIRNIVIPELKKINPALEKTFLHNQERFESLELLLKAKAKKILKKFYSTSPEGVELLGMSWFDVKNGGFVILEDILRPYGFNIDQCRAIIVALRSSIPGKRFTSDQAVLVVDRDQLVITPIEEPELPALQATITMDQKELVVGEERYTFAYRETPLEISRESKLAYLDADLLSYPLKARYWQEGDRFVPLGMKSQKKVSDFMIDEKIPVNLKTRVVLFESNQDIIWISGMRIDDRYKITKNTKRVFIITQERNV